MDLNEKLAQRRKEREQEVAIHQASQEVLQKTTVDVKVPATPSTPIDDRIKQALNDGNDRKLLLKKMAISRVKPWQWFVTIAGVFVSLAAMSESFFGGALLLGAFIWYAKNSLEKNEMVIQKEWAAIAEAKKLMQDAWKN